MAARESPDMPVLETLSFESSPTSSPQKPEAENPPLQCLFCTNRFAAYDSATRDGFLKHLAMDHKFVLGDVKQIANFEKYFEFWRKKFLNADLTEYCTVIKTNSKKSDEAPSEYFYLLCDALPEDKEIRQKLQEEKLGEVSRQVQFEREDTSFDKGCLFCREHFTGKRDEYFNHLMGKHGFNLGHPHNIVYKDELIDILEAKLDKFQCLYCERFFKDHHVLKEHMRKKKHKRINAQNKFYDRFYVVNYKELGQNWESMEKYDMEEDDEEDSDDSSHSADNTWDDWKEEEDPQQGTCLFCTHRQQHTMEHMKDAHGFDFMKLKHDLKLTFYQQVKLVNYIRRQVHQHSCIFCLEKCKDGASLLDHMISTGHIAQLPQHSTWDQPQYFFPTYEDDQLLCGLQDEEDDKDEGTATDFPVLPEEIEVKPEESALSDLYTLMGIELELKQIKDDDAADSNEETPEPANDEGSDCEEQEEVPQSTCLFCSHQSLRIMEHMKEVHGFDFMKLKHHLSLTFYQQVKLVNYIRKQVHHQSCILCEEKCEDGLLEHMTSTGHITQLPQHSVWDLPEYFSPTCEDDQLLCYLAEMDIDEETKTMDSSTDSEVVPEEIFDTKKSILRDEAVLRDLRT